MVCLYVTFISKTYFIDDDDDDLPAEADLFESNYVTGNSDILSK